MEKNREDTRASGKPGLGPSPGWGPVRVGAHMGPYGSSWTGLGKFHKLPVRLLDQFRTLWVQNWVFKELSRWFCIIFAGEAHGRAVLAALQFGRFPPGVNNWPSDTISFPISSEPLSISEVGVLHEVQAKVNELAVAETLEVPSSPRHRNSWSLLVRCECVWIRLV